MFPFITSGFPKIFQYEIFPQHPGREGKDNLKFYIKINFASFLSDASNTQ